MFALEHALNGDVHFAMTKQVNEHMTDGRDVDEDICVVTNARCSCEKQRFEGKRVIHFSS